MAIVLTESVKLILYTPPPPLDNPYPLGIWRGSRYIAGNATAGSISCIFAPPSAVEAKKYLWSWEGWSARIAAALGGVVIGALRLITAEPITDGGGDINNWNFYRSFTVAAGGALFGETFPYGDIVMDSGMNTIHQPGGGLTNSFQVILEDNVNLRTYTFAGWGYVWNPQARRLAGGPRRP